MVSIRRYVKLASRACSVLALATACSAAADQCGEPEEIGIFKSDEPGYEILVLKWESRVVKLKVKGKVADPKNEKVITKWVLDRTDEECE